MRPIDTNVVVRYLVVDDVEQNRLAASVVERGPVFVPLTVLLESEWALRDVYEFEKSDVLELLQAFARLPTVTFEEQHRAQQAFEWAAAGLEFADALHLASSQGHEAFATFDRRLARRARRLGVAADELRVQRAAPTD